MVWGFSGWVARTRQIQSCEGVATNHCWPLPHSGFAVGEIGVSALGAQYRRKMLASGSAAWRWKMKLAAIGAPAGGISPAPMLLNVTTFGAFFVTTTV